jgi:hypothetical protein
MLWEDFLFLNMDKGQGWRRKEKDNRELCSKIPDSNVV